jgi:hypothetical protein
MGWRQDPVVPLVGEELRECGDCLRACAPMKNQIGLAVASLFNGQFDDSDAFDVNPLDGRNCIGRHVRAPL